MGWVALGVLLVIGAWTLTDVATGFDHRYGTWIDYVLYRDAAARWLSGGGFYRAYQLAGPYPLFSNPQPILYPPVALWLFVPFVFLPAALWWVLPLAAVAWSLWRLRPAWWGWLGLLACALWPVTPEELINGNPVMWVWAAAFLAAVYAWPGPLVLMKPTLAPFALLGVRDRRWWAVLGLGLLAAVPFGGMWLDYASAARNVSAPVLYYIRDYPMLLMPAIAKASCRMLGSRSRSGYPRDMPRRDPVA